MSMPSDVTIDVTEALERMEPALPPATAPRSAQRRLSPEQVGMAVSALITFLGVAVIGPKLLELRRPRANLGYKAQRTARDARNRAAAASRKAQKSLRQLGGGTFRR